MKTLATLLNELDYGSNKQDIISKLPILAEKINHIILKIKLCNDITEAEEYFALLERIQSLISRLKFNQEIEIWGTLWKFARDFERIDTQIMQEILFKEIKLGSYPLIDLNHLLD